MVEAFGLPPSARVDMRVPKKMLAEQGAPTAADKRIILDGIDELQWFAACKPTTIGVPSFKDEAREYLEIAAVGCAFRPEAKTTRLIELIHRAIPYPVLLITTDAEGAALSLAHKRPAEREAGRIVIDRVVSTGPIGFTEVDQAFLASLALVRQPRHNLNTLYDGWLAQVEALQAAKVSGVYLATDDNDSVQRRREALENHTRLLREIALLRAKAGREKQMKGRVDLNLQIQRLQAALADLKTDL
ncbi:DUF4391 domain-containing protein [Paracoccus sp. (in: a-proteobacteria)]|uniref:DUF4391 domain-containing protein n=1 Tax=Paracoccus sp. TaxID=267 RepID=UPI002AFEA5E9|nr:DUF4391 domain-containing protein [Paracoccus sp. (in: a-proteobacteria)]